MSDVGAAHHGARRGRALLLAALLALTAGPDRAPAQTGGFPDLEAWERCRQRVRTMTTHRAQLGRRADSLAVERRTAAVSGDRAREQRLLARGEALADSLREASLAGLAQELLCAEGARELIREIDARLGEAGAAERDSLLARRERVQRGAEAPVRAEFESAPAQEDDPAEILRLKAAYARDLIDRADRWRERLGRERQRLVRERLSTEAGALIADQWFFDEHAALRVESGRPEEDPGRDEAPGFLGQVLREGRPSGGLTALELVDALESWLRGRRRELVAQADSLEREAAQREREP